MELRQLEYFVAVAEEANFTRAAERVHISQSGVSAQIRQLEHDLGATLIDRSGRATLTAAGAAALEHARAALGSVQALRHAVDEVTGVIRGRLAVGMVNGCTILALFDALAAFHRAHPGIEIALYEDNSDRLIDDVRTGATDLALIGAAEAPPAGLGALSIVSEGLVAVVPVGHPLTRRRKVVLADVVGYPVVCMPTGTGIRTVFDRSCAAKGLAPNIALQATAGDAVIDLAVRGLGVGVLSASMVADDDRRKAVAIADIDIPAVLALVWSPALNPALGELVRHCRRVFAAPELPGAPVGQPVR
jgi:DNA-binding transcriptional LysR family regulator